MQISSGELQTREKDYSYSAEPAEPKKWLQVDGRRSHRHHWKRPREIARPHYHRAACHDRNAVSCHHRDDSCPDGGGKRSITKRDPMLNRKRKECENCDVEDH